ncbi:hypothetical protein GCM10010172_07000 [Paractinoplanes ferrugineus]|uniref:Uncharacterized protein n=1 Tax=Paractinoplanes ferrugineus TaxID=113564 RepID=A0A919JAF5_9ACTN|nr:hypothetical protein [Actinoplanes ferrugineus]GIE16272.1 hypothetical protein Afe05nite_81120 [Actinoplanes ferrugineus]
MSWENTVRERRRGRRRKDHYEGKIAGADSSRKKLSAACDWLITEAWEAGIVGEIHGWVIDKVHEIRKEANRRDGNAA